MSRSPTRSASRPVVGVSVTFPSASLMTESPITVGNVKVVLQSDSVNNSSFPSSDQGVSVSLVSCTFNSTSIDTRRVEVHVNTSSAPSPSYPPPSPTPQIPLSRDQVGVPTLEDILKLHNNSSTSYNQPTNKVGLTVPVVTMTEEGIDKTPTLATSSSPISRDGEGVEARNKNKGNVVTRLFRRVSIGKGSGGHPKREEDSSARVEPIASLEDVSSPIYLDMDAHGASTTTSALNTASEGAIQRLGLDPLHDGHQGHQADVSAPIVPSSASPSRSLSLPPGTEGGGNEKEEDAPHSHLDGSSPSHVSTNVHVVDGDGDLDKKLKGNMVTRLLRRVSFLKAKKDEGSDSKKMKEAIGHDREEGHLSIPLASPSSTSLVSTSAQSVLSPPLPPPTSTGRIRSPTNKEEEEEEADGYTSNTTSTSFYTPPAAIGGDDGLEALTTITSVEESSTGGGTTLTRVAEKDGTMMKKKDWKDFNASTTPFMSPDESSIASMIIRRSFKSSLDASPSTSAGPHSPLERDAGEKELIVYYFTYALMQGVRHCTSPSSPLPPPPSSPASVAALSDHFDKHTISMEKNGSFGGSSLTLPCSMEFKDYSPCLYRLLRHKFIGSENDYVLSLCSDFNAIQTSKKGLVVSDKDEHPFSLYSHDGRLIIRSISKKESRFIRGKLKEYYHHVTTCKDSLLEKYLGSYRVTITPSSSNASPIFKGTVGNKELHFLIVLNDLSNLERRGRCVDVSYSVQGVHASRESTREMKSGEDDDDGSRIAAESDLLSYWGGETRRLLGPTSSTASLLNQLKEDVKFLQDTFKVSHYSLLLGLSKASSNSMKEGEIMPFRDIVLTANARDVYQDYLTAQALSEVKATTSCFSPIQIENSSDMFTFSLINIAALSPLSPDHEKDIKGNQEGVVEDAPKVTTSRRKSLVDIVKLMSPKSSTTSTSSSSTLGPEAYAARLVKYVQERIT